MSLALFLSLSPYRYVNTHTNTLTHTEYSRWIFQNRCMDTTGGPSIHICLYVFTCVHMYSYVFVCICMHLNIYSLRIRQFSHTHTHIHWIQQVDLFKTGVWPTTTGGLSFHINLYVFICIHMYLYVFVCISIYTPYENDNFHTHTHTFWIQQVDLCKTGAWLTTIGGPRVQIDLYIFICIHMYSYVFVCISKYIPCEYDNFYTHAHTYRCMAHHYWWAETRVHVNLYIFICIHM